MKTIPAAAGVVADRSLVGTALAAAYTAEIDAWLGSVIDDVGDVPGFALAAVGGYGRGDLSPGSDLDLLLIHQFEGSAAEVAERIWYPIWDTGMKLGHAVRTIDEALDLAIIRTRHGLFITQGFCTDKGLLNTCKRLKRRFDFSQFNPLTTNF